MKVWAIDLDGVLDNPKNVEKVNDLFEDPNNFIVVYTARSKKIREETEEYLHKLKVKYHCLKMEKLRADYYIDDKNILWQSLKQKI